MAPSTFKTPKKGLLKVLKVPEGGGFFRLYFLTRTFAEYSPGSIG